MGDFGYVALLIFIVIRVLIAAGLIYLVIVEIRRYKRKRIKGDEGPTKMAMQRTLVDRPGSGKGGEGTPTADREGSAGDYRGSKIAGGTGS
jgi:hypothetical protein